MCKMIMLTCNNACLYYVFCYVCYVLGITLTLGLKLSMHESGIDGIGDVILFGRTDVVAYKTLCC
jgi:hypothetical protein